MMKVKTLVILFLLVSGHIVNAGPGDNYKDSNHPRIFIRTESKPQLEKSIAKVEWKKKLIEQKKEKLEKYIRFCEKDSLWLVSRLQMNWKTMHSNVYLKGGNFSHSDGKAPVPTVRFSGTRDWATDYATPSIEDVEPYFDDARGMFFTNKKTGEKEWVHPSKVGHGIEKINRSILSLVADAAFLYWYTGDEKYARFAAPVFFTYMEGMHYRNPPEVLDGSNQQYISGLATFEVIHEQAVLHLAVAFDFLHSYFTSNSYNLDHTAAVFQKWGDQIIKFGIPDNNWNLFQARFLTYIAMVLEDDSFYKNGKGQQYFLKNTFEQSSIRQIALKESMLVYDQKNGIWPESPSYSYHVTQTLLEILTLLDNVTNENELANYPIIEKAALAAFQYLFPNGYTVGFGDSGHGILPPENYELLIANYRKYNLEKKEAAITVLLNQLIDKGLYKRSGRDFFELFFYVDELKAVSEHDAEPSKHLITPTFYAPNVSWFAQRIGEGDKAMMLSTVASYGNHCHANGIAIELFANNYALGADMGRGSSYWHSDFREYYSKMAAHNTVVVDGKSEYHNMRGYHPFTLDNHFPASEEPNPAFDKLTFSKVSFVEPSTQSDQQRLSALIKTPCGNGYVVDVFKSKKKKDGEQRHEYIYHNLGQSLKISDVEGKSLKMAETKELSSKLGDIKGYDYFTDKKFGQSDKDLLAEFRLKSDGQPDHLMKLWIKGSKDQGVFSVFGPKNNAISKGTAPGGIIEEKVPAILLRRETEAWNDPFVVVFNPCIEGEENPISGVSYDGRHFGNHAQNIEVMHVNGLTTDHILANASNNDLIDTEDLYQKGLLSVIRTTKGVESPDFIFLSGMIQFKWKDWEVTTTGKPVTISLETDGDKLRIQSDGPCVLKVPIADGYNPGTLVVTDDKNQMIKRGGYLNRDNPNQMEFRIEKAFKDAVILLK